MKICEWWSGKDVRRQGHDIILYVCGDIIPNED